MTDYYDSLDTQSKSAREAQIFKSLPGFLSQAINDCSGMANQLAGVDTASVVNRTELTKLPVLRKTDLMQAQSANPPFGGFVKESALPGTRVFMSPGPVWEPQVTGGDPWQGARALHAAGIRKGQRVHNAFSYHLTPGGFILDESARALGCVVFPAGVGNTESQIAAMHHFKPEAFIGTPDYLKILLDAAEETGQPVTCLNRAMVSGGALFPTLREHYENINIITRQCYATADLGIVAYETDANGECVPGMIINEGLIVEIVRPGTGEPVAKGDVGELVVTRLHGDYPLVRFATGDMSRFIEEPSPCGRTGVRIAGWMGRADQRTKVKGMFVDPGQLDVIFELNDDIRRVRLNVTRQGETDHAELLVQLGDDRAVTANGGDAMQQEIAQAFRSSTGLSADVRFADESLPNDGVLINDAREYDS